MIPEEMLREAAKGSLEDYVSSLERDYDSSDPHKFSLKFEKKIERLKRRVDHPVFYKTMHRVASILLVILVTGSAWITVDAEARAAFFGWVKERYETYFIYRFEDSANINTDIVNYRPTWIPEGYTEFYVDETEGTTAVVYANETGNMLKLNYVNNPDETDWFVKTEQVEIKYATINGCMAELFVSKDAETANAVMWITSDNTAFYLSAFLEEKDLLKVAESIQIK